jgi:hypothetical protein
MNSLLVDTLNPRLPKMGEFPTDDIEKRAPRDW